MTTSITLTTDAASMFLSWLENRDESLLYRLLEHPGYLAVLEHSGTWGSRITASDIVKAVDGVSSRMYGLARVRDNVDAIRGVIHYVEAHQDSILNLVDSSLARLFADDLAYPVELHCIVGYDWGIGLHGRVAINLNSRLYLDDFREIGYILVHEATHVAYERAHGPMSPEGMERPGGLRHLVYTLVQNEGLAVYSALHARVEGSCLENQDYRFLLDPPTLAAKTSALKRLLKDLTEEYPGKQEADRVLDHLSGERLSYVVGCSAFVDLEKQGGLPLVREAALWSPEEFIARAVIGLTELG